MRVFFSLFFSLLVLPGLCRALPVSQPAAKPNLTILVDENLILPAAALARFYAKGSHTPLTIVVKNSADAEEEIGQGLEAHLVLTSDEDLVARLGSEGVTDVTGTHSFARTGLALVTGNATGPSELLTQHISFAALIYATPKLPIWVESPSSNPGKRATALMQGYEFSPALLARHHATATHAELLEALRSTPSLSLMLSSDALNEPDVTVLSVLPETLSPPISYQVIVLASEAMGDARAFAHFLSSKDAQGILAHYGFEPSKAKP